MIRDFLNIEDDSMESSVEAGVRVPTQEICPSCNFGAVDTLPVGMMYASMQKFRKLYSPEQALCRGTLFCELDLPFRGGKKS